MKQLYLFFVCATLVVAGSMFLQSCENDRATERENEKIERIAESSEFEKFILAVSDYFHTFADIIKVMPLDEQASLFENVNDEDRMMQFLEKNNLIERSISLQESATPLLNNRNFLELSPDKQLVLFENHATFDMQQLPYFSRATRAGISCNQEFMDAFERQQAYYVTGMIFCIGTAWFSALCAATMTVIHFYEVNRLGNELQACLEAMQ